MNIGTFTFDQPVALAPMAGVSDRPLRVLARRFGADYAVTEMVSAQTHLWDSRKTRPRLDMTGEAAPRIVQIAGGEPRLLAAAARAAADLGADIVDINMGCPAKKVLDRQAGSALLRDEALVGAILDAVVAAVDVPVTLKMRTGWSPAERNGVRIARLAEGAGVAALTVHGRTRACAFRGRAEYATIAAIKQAVAIPVIANGDITTAAEARQVLAESGADGLMIGRAARGRPWIFGAIKAALAGRDWQPPPASVRIAVMREHLVALHEHYGVASGLRIARKHVGWYLEDFANGAAWRQRFVRLDTAAAQLALLDQLAAVTAWQDAA
ncbi:MAG: tRNA dihydrouridine synthase DusB [Gammaproteobacteria bacterium]|nr:tRNA dihydrouridine synthase DusB [Gammaproteobacteria bacterium]